MSVSILLLILHSIYAQELKIDSINMLINSSINSKEQIKSLETLCSSMPDSNFTQYNNILKTNIQKLDKEENNIQYAHYYYFLAHKSYMNIDDVEAIKYYLTGLEFIKNEKESYLSYALQLGLAQSYARIAFHSHTKKVANKAITAYLNAESALKTLENSTTELISLYILIGNAYHGINDNITAEKYYLKAEGMSRAIGKEKATAHALLNRGNLYYRYHELEKAEALTKRTFQFADSINYDIIKVYCLMNLTLIYSEKEEFTLAIEYANKTFIEAEKINSEHMMFRAYQELAYTYKRNNNLPQAARYFEESLKHLKANNRYFYFKQVYRELADVYLKLHKYNYASHYQKKYIALSDSLNLSDFNKKVELAESLFEHESTNFKNRLLDKENKLKKAELNESRAISISAIFTTILLIVLIIFQVRSKMRYKAHNKQITLQSKIISKQSGEITTQNNDLQKYKTKLEKLVEERTQELEIALDKAKESINLKDAFLRNISHEIRTPLNAIIGLPRLIEKQDKDKATKNLNIIAKSGLELLKTFDELIEVSGSESERLMLELNVYNATTLNEILNTQLHELAMENNTNNINFHTEFTSFKDEFTTDIKKLMRILLHLADNAFKFTLEGDINIKSVINKQNLDFIIKDTGIGMLEEEYQKIFNSFYKVEDKKHLTRGTGLGLTMVDLMVKSLKGKITIDSEVSKGTTIRISFPMNLQTKQATRI